MSGECLASKCHAANKAGSKEYSDVSIVGIVPEGVGVGEGSDVATARRGVARHGVTCDVMMDRPGGSPLIGRPVSRHHSTAGRR